MGDKGSRLASGGPEGPFPMSLCPCVESEELKNSSLILPVFMMVYRQDKSRKHILCASVFTGSITFEYLDSGRLSLHLSSSLSLAYVVGYKTR